MEITQLLNLVKHALEDKKAEDIQVLDVSKLSSFTDMMVIASGLTSRQVSAMAMNVIEQAKAHGKQPLSECGRDFGEWALVDLGEIVVHVMQPQIRNFYQLERLWGDMEGVELV